MTPFFSVIVPVYNMQCYLHECLQSIIDQSFSDFEIILVDNGSTDKSPEICRTYANQYPFVKVYVQPVAGVSAARNLGMSKCQGEYIVFVDSDDYLKANALRVLYDVITQENVDVLYYNLDVLENGAITPFDLAKEFKGTRTLSCNSAYRSILSNTGFRGYSCNKVFKRKKIEGLQFNINIHYLEDTLFNVEVIKLKPTIRTIDDSLYVYRQRGDSMSHGAFTLKKKTYLDALDVIQAEVPKALLPEIIRNRKLMELDFASRVIFKDKQLLRELHRRFIGDQQAVVTNYLGLRVFQQLLLRSAELNFYFGVCIYCVRNWIKGDCERLAWLKRGAVTEDSV